jgi:hypothetical protein
MMDDSRQSRPAVRVGQIWQRNEYLDGRPWPGQGYVMIAYTTPTHATLHACEEDGSLIAGNKAGDPRKTTAMLKRFGKRGGYRLHRDIEPPV